MQWGRIWICAVTILATIGEAFANDGRAVVPRQGSISSSQPSASSSSSSSRSGITTISSQNDKPTSIPPSMAAASSQLPSSFTTILRPSTTMPPVTNISSIVGIGTDSSTLPLPPAITPALSVAGVFLMLSGIVYTLIGIKNKWVQIFISAAYVTSLAITVLIVYVMNPPISNAVQGAYFVAAFVPALIIGGGALIFKDVTEGIGCAVGGFCVSMWILILVPGGTITSTAGKAIFIGIFCVLFYGLSFSHYTRYYALIGSTSFGGATTIVLGIDCFSLAGFKEFWLYVWNLNDNLFPLQTATYPITRGIRVETAAIVIFSVIGIMSQLKIWKVIQERRRKQLQEKEAEDRERQQAEEEVGRRLVAGNGREQEQWEAAYGDGTRRDQLQADSGVGTENNSLRKVSMSTGEPRLSQTSQGHVIEMNALDQRGRTEAMNMDQVTEPARVSVYATPGDERLQAVSQNGNPAGLNAGSRVSRTSLGNLGAGGLNRSATGIPMLGPLAFECSNSIPDGSDDTSSIATYASSDRRNSRYLNRLSAVSLMKTITGRSQRNSLLRLASDDSAEVITDGNAGAAINPDEASREPEPASSPQSHHIRENSIGLSIEPEHVHIPESCPGGNAENTPVTMLTEIKEHNAAGEASGAGDLHDSEAQRTSLVRPLSGIKETTKRTPSVVSTEPASHQSFADRLPEAGPKVAAVYRTNEWAKHLDKAEKPEVDKLGLLKPSESQESDSSEEPVAAVDLQALQSTALGPPIQTLRSPADIPKNLASEYALTQRHSPPASVASADSLKYKPVGSLSRKTSQQGELNNANQPTSTSLPILKTKALRTSSTPVLASPLVESPIEEGVETTTFQPRYVSSPLAPTGTTLLAQRSSMLLNKHLSTSPGYSRTSSYSSTGLPTDLDDNIPLSQRRSLLQLNVSPKPQQQTTYPPPTGPRSLSPSARRASMLAAWRSSLQQDVPVQVIAGHETETRRAEMLALKHKETLRKQEEILRDRKREENWGQAMRTGGMVRAHREVLSRMQSGVNERLRSEDR